MARRQEQLLAKAFELPPGERARLAHQLLMSLEEDPIEDPATVEKAWAKEVGRRLDDLETGKVKAIPWSTARAQLRKRLRRRRPTP